MHQFSVHRSPVALLLLLVVFVFAAGSNKCVSVAKVGAGICRAARVVFEGAASWTVGRKVCLCWYVTVSKTALLCRCVVPASM